MFDFKKVFASVNNRVRSSVIRELLNLTNKPGIISFAGGLPDPKLFPVKLVEKATLKVLKKSPHIALQYGPTNGLDELKYEIIKKLEKDDHLKNLKPDNVLICTASQQALALVARTFIDEGDVILVELPSYLGALQVFGSYGARLEGVRSDDKGVILEDLELRIKQLKSEGAKLKFLYVVPDFQNPSGVSMAPNRRKKLIDMAYQYDLLIIEDTPYRELRFEGKMPDLLYKLQREANVISLFTFSKTLVPGFRLGYIIAHEEIIKKISVLKQSMDLCSSPFNQLITLEMMKGAQYSKHIQKINKAYKKKRDAMLKALDEFMPKHKNIKWTRPEGGLFLWLEVPPQINCDELFHKALDKKVAFVIGSAFHCDGSGKNTMRINFSYPNEKDIVEGIKRLALTIEQALRSDQNKIS